MATTTAPPTAPTTTRAPMDSLRKISLVAGVLYLLTFVSIPTLGGAGGAGMMGGAAPVIAYTTAALLALGYVALSLAISSTVLMRRDVTS